MLPGQMHHEVPWSNVHFRPEDIQIKEVKLIPWILALEMHFRLRIMGQVVSTHSIVEIAFDPTKMQLAK